MSMIIRYECSLCGKEMRKVAATSDSPEGWALTWCGTALEPIRPWRESPIHLCQTCVSAVAGFAKAAANCGELVGEFASETLAKGGKE